MAEKYALPSGEIAELEYPDIYSIFALNIPVPDPITAAVINLLELEGSYIPETDPLVFKHRADKQRGLYAMYAMCRVDKKVDLSIKHSEAENVLGRLDIVPIDLDYVFYTFFRRRAAKPLETLQSTLVSKRVSSDTPVS